MKNQQLQDEITSGLAIAVIIGCLGALFAENVVKHFRTYPPAVSLSTHETEMK